jgi:hypothetical protein
MVLSAESKKEVSPTRESDYRDILGEDRTEMRIDEERKVW